MYTYIIALGSNLGNKSLNLDQALSRISEFAQLQQESSRYLTQPLGPADETFINSAAQIHSELSPEQLLDRLLGVEEDMGRIRDVKWGNRTIDLDIIFAYQGEDLLEINTAKLVIPHPEALKRDFVMVPASEVAPDKAMDTQGMSIIEWTRSQKFSLANKTP